MLMVSNDCSDGHSIKPKKVFRNDASFVLFITAHQCTYWSRLPAYGAIHAVAACQLLLKFLVKAGNS
jgi:hypothetical protein